MSYLLFFAFSSTLRNYLCAKESFRDYTLFQNTFCIVLFRVTNLQLELVLIFSIYQLGDTVHNKMTSLFYSNKANHVSKSPHLPTFYKKYFLDKYGRLYRAASFPWMMEDLGPETET